MRTAKPTAKRLVSVAWLPVLLAGLAALPGCERTPGGPEPGKEAKKTAEGKR